MMKLLHHENVSRKSWSNFIFSVSHTKFSAIRVYDVCTENRHNTGSNIILFCWDVGPSVDCVGKQRVQARLGDSPGECSFGLQPLLGFHGQSRVLGQQIPQGEHLTLTIFKYAKLFCDRILPCFFSMKLHVKKYCHPQPPESSHRLLLHCFRNHLTNVHIFVLLSLAIRSI